MCIRDRTKPELVEQAQKIFKEAHREDPVWPLSGITDERREEVKKVWATKRKRDKEGWIPPDADERLLKK